MQHTDIKGVTHDVYFKCPTCNCRRFQRPHYCSDKLTFLEGYFECINCYEEFCYHDEVFTLVQAQLNLFD